MWRSTEAEAETCAGRPDPAAGRRLRASGRADAAPLGEGACGQPLACALDSPTLCATAQEEELASDLQLQGKLVRRTLRYLEEDQLLLRGAVKEKPRDVAQVAAAAGRFVDADAPDGARARICEVCPTSTHASTGLLQPRTLVGLLYASP